MTILLVFSGISLAADGMPGMGMPDMEGSNDSSDRRKAAMQSREDRLEKMKDAANEYAEQNRRFLETVISAVNNHRRFSDKDLEIWWEQIRESRRGMKFFDDSQISDYYLLSAWYDFYKGEKDNVENALKNSARAYQINPENGDAYVSQWLFSILEGKQPRPVIDKRRPTREERMQRDRDIDLSIEMSQPRLEIYPDELTVEYLDSDIASKIKIPDEYKNFEYVCALFVPSVAKPEEEDSKEESDSGDSNEENNEQQTRQSKEDRARVFGDAARKKEAAKSEDYNDMGSMPMPEMGMPAMMDPMMGGMPGEYGGVGFEDTADVAQSLRVIDWMEMSCQCLDEIAFAVINTAPDGEDALAELMTENKLTVQFATIDNPDELPKELEVIKTLDKSLMLIVSADKKLKYAGRADGVTAPMILNQLKGDCMNYLSMEETEEMRQQVARFNPDDIERMRKSGQAGYSEDMNFGPAADPMMGMMNPNAGPGDYSGGEQKKEEPEYKELSEEHKAMAERLIQSATMHRKSLTRLGSSNKCISDCLEVMDTFRGSIYAEQAREILKSVPERHLKKAGIKREEIDTMYEDE
ncbi:hypothetical protein [Limihaloglobus sulfuriphilus]|nr:hypothetical protein [Limihaloglobus sulfuriphilus]